MAGRSATKVPPGKSPFYSNLVGDAAFTLGAETANARVVNVQLKDQNGRNLTKKGCVKAYLSSDANGNAVAAAPDGAVVAGATGIVFQPVAKTYFTLVTNASGSVDISITDSTVRTMYLVLLLPDGSVKVSPAIAWA
jgi:hypothetical protein